jgi:hypothetical protein
MSTIRYFGADGCRYVDPNPMAPDTFYWQGFAPVDYGPNGLNAIFALSEDGGLIVGSDGTNDLVLTRSGSSFSSQILSIPGGYEPASYQSGGDLGPCIQRFSRSGVLAGSLAIPGGISLSTNAAIWNNGPSSTPTIYTDMQDISAISDDGLSAFGRLGVGPSPTQTIERVIATTTDLPIENVDQSVVSNIGYCKKILININGSTGQGEVFKKTAGAWGLVAYLTGGSPTGLDGDAKIAMGIGTGSANYVWWDLTMIGSVSSPSTISGNVLVIPAGYSTNGPGAISQNGKIIIGGAFISGPPIQAPSFYWLKSEGFSTAHNLIGFINSQGSNGLGSANYPYPLPTQISATGNHICFGNNGGLPGYISLPIAPS